jgi:hypothetical protein
MFQALKQLYLPLSDREWGWQIPDDAGIRQKNLVDYWPKLSKRKATTILTILREISRSSTMGQGLISQLLTQAAYKELRGRDVERRNRSTSGKEWSSRDEGKDR